MKYKMETDTFCKTAAYDSTDSLLRETDLAIMEIVGGKPLEGTITIQGSKNAALPMMAAALLSEEASELIGCPDILDVRNTLALLEELGVKTTQIKGRVRIDAGKICTTEISEKYANKMRSSIMLLGTLLGRFQSVEITYPGGCVIGKRPIDMHLDMLHAFGVVITECDGRLRAERKSLRGTIYRFLKKSVGATEHGILTAVLAEGESIFYNCAQEPEIISLCTMLVQMGAQIEGSGTSRILIRGVKKLHGIQKEVPKDRIAAGTYLLAGAATRGKVTLDQAPVQEMEAILYVYGKMGGQYKVIGGKLLTDSRKVRYPVRNLQTREYPGFPTDLQSPFLAACLTIPGVSQVEETIFENRFKVVCQLQKMGGKIWCDNRRAVVWGGVPLKGTHVIAEELRGGAALVIASLYASGKTVIENCQLIQRGYENICQDLYCLGADISI
ncbi:MAG: UDP-N-acetylglucosamine 1-carboxyvinyltransferase [Lachnospiraceae bacterium]|nr:UDP-N-acetylglucosamine 1-carboxyvinyltransferase [Lachnospiraceae bacterium]